MTGDPGFGDCTVEDVNDSDLLVKWEEFTDFLLSRGHAAELYHILSLQTGYENPLGSPTIRAACSQNKAARQKSADGTGTDVSSHESSGDVASPFCQNESDTDDSSSLYDGFCNVPHDLIDDAKDLSSFLHPESLATCAGQQYLAANDIEQSRVDHAPERLCDTVQPMDRPQSLELPSLPDQHQQQNAHWDNEPVQDSTKSHFEGKVSIDELGKIQATSFVSKSPTTSRKQSIKTGTLRVSDKRNLTPQQLPIVADLLVSRDAMAHFLQNRNSIRESMKPFSVSPLEIRSSSLERSVIAAFETVRELLNGNRVCRLFSRFASIGLISLIDAYKATAADDRTQSDRSRRRGHGDATVAIDLYLQAMRKTPGKTSERSRVLAYCRSGRRWKMLAGRAPILVLMFPQIAETIVYVRPFWFV